MFAVEHVLDERSSVAAFFDGHFSVDASDRVHRFRALDLDPSMTMRAFWDLHSIWSLQILRGDGVPPEAVAAAATHHVLENVNPHAMLAADPRLSKYVGSAATCARPVKLIILLDKYDAARRRGHRTHPEAITWLRDLIARHPRFCQDQGFVTLIAGIDVVASALPVGR
jgi:hypothetical protein